LTQRDRVALTSRVFCLAAVFGLALVAGNASTIQALVAVAAVAAMSTYVSVLTPSAALWAVTAESLIVGLIMGLNYPSSLVLLPYLVVLPFISGLSGGLAGVAATMSAQVLAVLLVPLVSTGFDGIQSRIIGLAPWLLTNFGAGMLGVWARQLAARGSASKTDDSYESARRLLTQLSSVARRLSAGLDADSMAVQLLAAVGERHTVSQAAVFVKSDGSVFVPLGYHGEGAPEALLPHDALVHRCWTTQEPQQSAVPSATLDRRNKCALPLRIGSRMVGVVLITSGQTWGEESLTLLMAEVDQHSLRIDTALAFEEIRSMATTDERQRLAREIHDGIAQDVASLGYSVDDLVASTDDPSLTDGLQALREELSRVVAELRFSIFDLRSDVNATSGLGAALSDYVRQVGSKTSMKVHLSLDEAPTRLRPIVEEQLLRIAQEAITNARKHASAQNLWVDYWTDPPGVRLTITDDGVGPGDIGDDSYGMEIMRERAHRIEAALDVTAQPAPAHGTVVSVTMDPRHAAQLQEV
jgi:signal transduction histidine kinase